MFLILAVLHDLNMFISDFQLIIVCLGGGDTNCWSF